MFDETGRSTGPQAVGGFGAPSGVDDSDGAGGSGHFLLTWLEVSWRRRWVFLVTIGLGLVVSFVYLMRATPIYRSESRLSVERSATRLISQMDGPVVDSKNYLHTQARYLQSTPILSRAAEFAREQGIATLRDIDPAAQTKLLADSISVDVGRQDDTITVAMRSTDPTDAAVLCNAVVDAYVEVHGARRKNTAKEILEILRTEKSAREGQLGEKRRLLAVYQAENVDLALEDGQNVRILSDRLGQLGTELITARGEERDAYREYDQMRRGVQDPRGRRTWLSVIDDGRQRRERLLSETEELESWFEKTIATDHHPTYQKNRRKLLDLRRELDIYEHHILETRLAEKFRAHELARQRLGELETEYESQRLRVLSVREQRDRLRDLQSQVSDAEEAIRTLDRRIGEIDVDEDAASLEIFIFEVATPNLGPVEPRRSKAMALGLFFGALLGALLSLLLEAIDQRVRSPDELSAVSGLPLLGLVPSLSAKSTPHERGTCVERDSKSPTSEAIRTLRTALLLGFAPGKCRRILLTSAVPGDGKTTVASNLAIAMAQAGHRTLLLDADFRKPRVHVVFEVERDKGIPEFLAGQVSLHSLVRKTSCEGLEILPVGRLPANPSELLESRGFRDVIEELSQSYDCIVVDSPPVLPVADSRILSGMCDVVLLVARVETSSRKSVRVATQALLGVGAKVAGLVANGVRRRGRYGEYYYYQYESDARNREEEIPTPTERVSAGPRTAAARTKNRIRRRAGDLQ